MNTESLADPAPSYNPSYHDAVVVGGGVAGCSMAYALAQQGRKVALIERDLSEPDRIVGELMQPGGCLALESLGLADCLEEIDAIQVQGYVLVKPKTSEYCRLEYPPKATGRHFGKSFHHGRFIMRLRDKCRAHDRITVIQATVSDLIRDLHDPKVVGVHATTSQGTTYQVHADLTVVADGCFSKFRTSVLGTKMHTSSHFIGLILHDCALPFQNYGHVVLADPSPVLLYQISTHDTRILIDVPQAKLPSNKNNLLVTYLQTDLSPQLPESVRPAFLHALQTQKLRMMPNPYLPSRAQGQVAGLLLIGDAHNMRHPLTGGGMSVALHDVVILSRLLKQHKYPVHDLGPVLKQWYWERKSLSSVINILADALYSLFSCSPSSNNLSAPCLDILRNATFKYLQLNGEYSESPVRLLAGISPRPWLLCRHFFQVALYAAYHLFMSEPWYLFPRTVWKQIKVLYTSVQVIVPLCWYEIRGAPQSLAESLDSIASASRTT